MRFLGLKSIVHAMVLAFADVEKKESLAVGGQAVMEGIMMRNGSRLSIALRRPDGEITVTSLPWYTLFKGAWTRKPCVRGFPILLETLVNGIKALNISAEVIAEGEGEKIKPWQILLTLCLAVGLAMLLFVVVPHLLTVMLGWLAVAGQVEGFSFQIWDGLLKFGMFIGYILLISRLPDIRRVFEYHGAEHKAIAAYEHGENPVSSESARSYSRLHPRCGTAFLLFVLCISILIHTASVPFLFLFWTPENVILKHSVVIVFKFFLMMPISALAYESIRLAARMDSGLFGTIVKSPGLMLQMLTTREPDKGQLEVALVALKEALQDEASAIISTPEYIIMEQE